MAARYLGGIVDLPYVTPQGRFVTRPGYDPGTALYLDIPIDWQIVAFDRIDADQLRGALRVLTEPFSAYCFANADSAAGMLSGIFAAVGRSVMDLCPAYLFDASQQGSGKTKAATALGALIEGRRVGVTPFSGSGASADDEFRKRMVAGAIKGVRFHCIDNLTGYFKSSALAAVLTSGRLSDRVLQVSQMIEAKVCSLVTLTANNASMDADLQRRTVQVRIDAGSAPTLRAFAFDPVSVALAQRRRIAEAVCVVWRAYFEAGAPDIVIGDAGGFADWNRLCRQPVLWLAREGYGDALPWPELGDPAASMLADPAANDPDIEATGDLLVALWALSEGRDFTSAEVFDWYREGESLGGVPGDLRSAVTECATKQVLSIRSMGRTLMNRRERPVQGFKLLSRGGSGSRFKLWRVVLVEQASAPQ